MVPSSRDRRGPHWARTLLSLLCLQVGCMPSLWAQEALPSAPDTLASCRPFLQKAREAQHRLPAGTAAPEAMRQAVKAMWLEAAAHCPAAAAALARNQAAALEGDADGASRTVDAAGRSHKPELESPLLDLTAQDTHYHGHLVRESGGLVSGTGEVRWAQGDVYTGQILHSQRHGEGEIVWAHGQRYAGEWFHDHPSGRGRMRFANGNVYEGMVLDGQPQGLGRMAYASGDVYKGQMQQGQPQGQGRMSYASGDVYEGHWQAGRPQGQGVYRWASGDRYEGAWVAGKKQGQGIFTWASGERWSGRFQDDAPVQAEAEKP